MGTRRIGRELAIRKENGAHSKGAAHGTEDEGGPLEDVGSGFYGS